MKPESRRRVLLLIVFTAIFNPKCSPCGCNGGGFIDDGQCMGGAIQATGEIGSASNDPIPGYPGKKVKYYVTAGPNFNAQSASFLLQVCSEEFTEIKVVVCAMLDLNVDEADWVDSETYEIRDSGFGEWECENEPATHSPPNYHFGCKQITIPAATEDSDGCKHRGTTYAFQGEAFFDRNVTTDNLGAIYFDMLKDQPIDTVFNDCSLVVGTNKFLYPSSPTSVVDWVNVWAGHFEYAPLELPVLAEPGVHAGTKDGGQPRMHPRDGGEGGTGDTAFTAPARARWPEGNWVTMGYPAPYPARFVATLKGAPAGARLSVVHDGAPGGVYIVPADPAHPPCGGLDTAIDDSFVVAGTMGARAEAFLSLARGCDFTKVPEGAVASLEGVVRAAAGAPYYALGERMYEVDIQFVRDTVEPDLTELEVLPDGNDVRVKVEATDADTLPISATFVYQIDGGAQVVEPLSFAASPVQTPHFPTSTAFDETVYLGSYAPGAQLLYFVAVRDEVGNLALSPTGSATLPLSPPIPCGNGVLQPGEDCDPPASQGGTANCTDACTLDPPEPGLTAKACLYQQCDTISSDLAGTLEAVLNDSISPSAITVTGFEFAPSTPVLEFAVPLRVGSVENGTATVSGSAIQFRYPPALPPIGPVPVVGGQFVLSDVPVAVSGLLSYATSGAGCTALEGTDTPCDGAFTWNETGSIGSVAGMLSPQGGGWMVTLTLAIDDGVLVPDRATFSLSGTIQDAIIDQPSSPGEADSLTVDRSALDLVLTWQPGCAGAAGDYAVYEGAIGSWYSHTLLDCSDAAGDLSEVVTPSDGNRYYLVVPLRGGLEGSFGRASSGQERPRGTQHCVPTQVLGACP